MSEPLRPDTALDVRLSAIIARHQYDTAPAPALDALRAAAGDRTDILAKTAGMWAGFHEVDQHMRVLAAALREIPGAAAWVELGRERRGAASHGTTLGRKRGSMHDS